MRLGRKTGWFLALPAAVLLFDVSGCANRTAAPVTTANPATSASSPISSVLATATFSGPVTYPAPGNVWLFDLAVIPEVITIKEGETVTWTDYDTLPYTITSDDELFISPILAWGGSWAHTFSKAGVYRYHVSEDMNGLVGEIIVQ